MKCPRIGMVRWNLPEEGKSKVIVGVTLFMNWYALVQSRGNFVQLLFSQPKPKGCYLWSYKSDSINKIESVNIDVLHPFQIVFLNLGLDVLHLHSDDWAFLNRSIPTVEHFMDVLLMKQKFADNLKQVEVSSVIIHLNYR